MQGFQFQVVSCCRRSLDSSMLDPATLIASSVAMVILPQVGGWIEVCLGTELLDH